MSLYADYLKACPAVGQAGEDDNRVMQGFSQPVRNPGP